MGGDRLVSALSSVQEITEVRERAAATTRADRVSAVLLGLGYLATALACASRASLPSPGQVALLAGLIVLYALAYRTEFVAAGGATVPTQPVLVGLLLAAPLPLVPLAVLGALQLGNAGAQEPGALARRLLIRMISGWHCLGPVAVLWVFPTGPPGLGAWPVYLLALAAQFAADAATALTRCWALGIPPARLAASLRWTFSVDALLAPLGLCVVIASAGRPAGTVLLAAPILLVRLLARDRNEQLETAVALGTAYSAVQEEARMDVLTGLANRRAWLEAVQGAGARLADDPGLQVIVLVADVDGLKRVNDSLGHDTGDELIKAVGGIVQQAAPDGVAARLGGDEFGLLLLTRAGSGLAESLVPRVRALLQYHPGFGGQPLSASLGVATCPPAASVADAVTKADLAAGEDKIRRRAGRTT